MLAIVNDSFFSSPRYAFQADSDEPVREHVLSDKGVAEILRGRRHYSLAPVYKVWLTPEEMVDGVITATTEDLFSDLDWEMEMEKAKRFGSAS